MRRTLLSVVSLALVLCSLLFMAAPAEAAAQLSSPLHTAPFRQTAPSAAATVTVAVDAVLRDGPGFGYAAVGNVKRGSTLAVVGCAATCTWYKTTDGQ